MVEAKCIVPAKFARYTWPDKFEVLPRLGDTIQPIESSVVGLIVAKVVHKNHEEMSHPLTYTTKIELHLVPPPERQLLENRQQSTD